MNFVDHLSQTPIVPVLRKIPLTVAEDLINTLISAGIKTIEITMDSEGAEEFIRLAKKLAGKDVLIGAGTVLDINDAQRAVDAGAEFIVSPILKLNVLEYGVSKQIPVVPGVFSPTEMYEAIQQGASAVKVFPASTLGPGYIKDVLGPLSTIPIMVTGGITSDTASQYFKAGAVAVGAGGALLRNDIISSGDWNALTEEVKKWIQSSY